MPSENPLAAELSADGQTLEIRGPASDGPLLIQRATPPLRPCLHPLAAPDGDGTLTEDRPGHHPWQHGIYTGMHGVNGEEFWTERPDKDGSFNPSIQEQATDAFGAARWRVATPWIASDGRELLRETQAWSAALDPDPPLCRLDLDWTLAAEEPVRVDQCAYGGLFVRMPWRPDRFHQVANSEGAGAQPDCEGRPARWVAVSLCPPDRQRESPVGIALLEHPSSPEHPNRWRVDGQYGFSPSRCICGPWTLEKGETTVSRYRLVCFVGEIDPAFIDGEWRRFSDLQPDPRP